MARMLRNEPGDWVAVKAPGAPGGAAPAKVVEASPDQVVVELRGRRLHFDAPLPRIRWQRQRGRARWSYI